MVENAFESIQGRGVRAVAICGEPYHGGRMPVRQQPGLGYSLGNEKISPGPLWYSLKMAARQALGAEPDLWHFHNPALGKNSAMAEVVGKMAAEAPVLLQFHDFAEDGRPANYAMLRERMENIGKLYPQASQVHYATTNSRDLSYLRQSGFRQANVHLLGDPVRVPQGGEMGAGGTACGADGVLKGAGTDFNAAGAALSAGNAAFSSGQLAGFDALQDGQPLYLYPTRAIRRKNIGEFLLWAALSAAQEEDALFAMTLEPENPQARPVYERWVAFAKEQGLPLAFGVGQGRGAPPFAALMQRAQAIVSTSVAEGFGLAFLEPWLFGKEVLGRNLPEITTDFSQQGLDLSRLYERLLVADDLFDSIALRDRLAAGLKRTYAAYCRPLPEDAVERCLHAAGDGTGRIDFGRLDEMAQEQVIAALVSSGQVRSGISPLGLSAGIETIGGEKVGGGGEVSASCGAGTVAAQQRIAANAQAVAQNYGLDAYGERLYRLYRLVADSPRAPLEYADPQRLLDKFLEPERFLPLCS